MGFLTFFLTALFISPLPAGATVPRWALLSITLPFIVFWRDVQIPRSVFIVSVYVSLTGLFSPNAYAFFYDYWLFILLLYAFCIGRTLDNLRSVFIGAALGLWLNSTAVIGQYFGWWTLPQIAENSGLFFNRNFAVEAAAMTFIAAVCYRSWWLLPGLVPTMLAGARAPVLALGVVGVLVTWKHSRKQAVTCVMASAALMLWLSDARSPDLAGAVSSSVERLAIWQDTLAGLSIFGHGLGSFGFEFPTLQVHTDALKTRYEHPHNELLQIAYEFGVAGIFLVGLLLYHMGRPRPDAAWCALAVFLVEGCFAFPLYMPVTGFLAALCAGHISRGGTDLRGSVAVGRPALSGRDGAKPA